jgi:hypothetical protein
MVGVFRMICSDPVAALVPRDVRLKIIEEAVAKAEKLGLEAGASAIFDIHALQLKVVVDFHGRVVHLLTKDEADALGLPDKPASNSSN